MPASTAPTYDYTRPPSTNVSSQFLSESAPPPSYTALPQASEAEKQRAREAISSPSHVPSDSYAELLKQWCFAQSPTPSPSAQDTPGPTSNSERSSPIWRGISLGMDGFNGLSPHHTFTSTEKNYLELCHPPGQYPAIYLVCPLSRRNHPQFPFPSILTGFLISMPKQSGYSDPFSL